VSLELLTGPCCLHKYTHAAIDNNMAGVQHPDMPRTVLGCHTKPLAGKAEGKGQMLQSECLHIATDAPWDAGNREIREDFGIPFFADREL